MACSFASWREPEAVLGLATLAVAEREGIARRDIASRLEPFSQSALGESGSPPGVRFFDMPRLDISSSDIRRRVASGAPIRHLVPDAVAAHIAEHQLYRSARVEGAR